jgi:hypothetical protein
MAALPTHRIHQPWWYVKPHRGQVPLAQLPPPSLHARFTVRTTKAGRFIESPPPSKQGCES